MKKINIICVGSIKEQYIKSGIDEFLKRLSKNYSVKIIELSESKMSNNNPSKAEREIIIQNESKSVLDKIKGFTICLCIEGRQYSSEEFAQILDKSFNTNSEVSFIIGGSYGLSSEVKAKSNLNLSFSKFTFPHQLMRLILLEQIYRADTIICNTPYHK